MRARGRLSRVVAVDTTSRDESPELLAAALDGPGDSILTVRGDTGYPAAVAAGLDRVDELDPAAEWIWLLHDDSRPEPDALDELLQAAGEHPDADVLGPKLREWPSLRRLLELGVTISGTGRRETGLERGEYDQGQHDEIRTVLAVNTAGMLVRRRVLDELGGFEERLPVFGNDLDFGWRAAAAGHRTLVVPRAVVFHAEAAHRGLRRTPLTGRHTHYQERRAALFTLLANCSTRALPFQLVRLALGTLVRMVGFLLVRSVGEALDELAALVSVYSGPGDLRAARRRRAVRRNGAGQDVRALLAPRWLPYRHGLDFVSDVASALGNQASDVADRRRAAAAQQDPSAAGAVPPTRGGTGRAGARPADDDQLDADTGLVARFLTNPVALVLALVVVAALVGARGGYGPVSGAALSPAPDSVADWWRLHLESWHPLGTGTDVPAPAYLVPLALLGTLLLGSAAAAVSVLLVLAVPVALWGAWRFLRLAGRLASPAGAPRWLVLGAAVSYALVPVVSGGWAQGRLDVVVAAATLPWLAHAALGFADPDPDRRWRAAWRAAVLLALVSAFAPVLWIFTAVLGGVVVAAAFGLLPSVMGDRSTWGPPLVAVLVVPVLLLPWWLPALLTGASAGLLLGAGGLPASAPDAAGLLLGRLADPGADPGTLAAGLLGAPWWLGLVLPVLALLALLPRPSRVPVLLCWVVALVGAGVAAVLSLPVLELTAVRTAPATAVLLVVLQGVFVVAALLGFQAALGSSGAPARTATAVLLAGAAVAAGGGLGWFVLEAQAPSGGEGADIPAYMVQSSRSGAERGILVVRGTVDSGLTYTIRRGDGVTLGEDEILALSEEDRDLTDDVRTLASRPTPAVVDVLADHGIEYVVLPAPADGDVAASLDATGGLLQASAEDRSTRAWQVDRPLDPGAVSGPGRWWRGVLLAVQALALVAALVLAAPTTPRARSEEDR